MTERQRRRKTGSPLKPGSLSLRTPSPALNCHESSFAECSHSTHTRNVPDIYKQDRSSAYICLSMRELKLELELNSKVRKMKGKISNLRQFLCAIAIADVCTKLSGAHSLSTLAKKARDEAA